MLTDVQDAIRSRPAGTRLVVLSDFDGTLADFDPDPDVPRPTPQTARSLGEIAARPDVSLGIVSGRRIADLRTRVELPASVYLAGLHGLEIEVGARRWQHPDLEEARRDVRLLHERLEEVRDRIPGLLVEDKDASVAVHVRPVAPALRDRALASANGTAEDLVAKGRLRRLQGNMVLEFLPNIATNKGHAVSWIVRDIETAYRQAAWVVFVGDDVTDEDAFKAITNGIGVLVGSRETHAPHQLASTREVDTLLAWLARGEYAVG